MNKHTVLRVLIYIAALLILAMGLTLNTKSGLGVSPIISVAYCVSIISGHNFGNTTLVLYIIFVLVEIILHLNRSNKLEKSVDDSLEHVHRTKKKFILVMDLLQIPFSIVFTRFLNIFNDALPEFQAGDMSPKTLILRFLVLAAGLIFTGVGAAMSLNMRIVPNPGDGIVQAIADCINKSVGFTKNCVDIASFTITIIISLTFSGALHGVGVGTILAVIFVGRIIAVFNHFTKDKLDKVAGIVE